ncbi:methylmalonyl Co-A mutase-associated GTPase MeaB [Rhabdothermincola sediminis]|uniref:methylmalonyl Co-A mutase-associated GTPase MeaB n=1 Tax=Rhabdothermincola sediminis TaxID=2751370 RepID=UPI001AA081FB|nr:methylmalonyl Co-A mutase-associated GTPase MeaB [Rhabdothermincola sediminis]
MPRPRVIDPAELLARARGGDRSALARLLSIVEEGGAKAHEVGRLAHPLGGSAITVGITGSPGAGKSTLTSALVSRIRAAGERVAVLAVDPSSPFTGGAILGDRVRMGDHALDDGVFIRSMATRGHLGGLALATPQAVRVLDATGWPWVVIETVGVGQVEVEVASETDTTVVVLNPGWGDAVQANKAGLMEVADVFVINKADRSGVADTRRDLQQMLELSSPDGWSPPIIDTVAITGEGVDELWRALGEHRDWLARSGRRHRRLTERASRELHAVVAARLAEQAEQLGSDALFDELVGAVVARELDPWTAADRLLASGA